MKKSKIKLWEKLKIRNLAQTFQVEPVSFKQNCDNLMALVHIGKILFPRSVEFWHSFFTPSKLTSQAETCHNGAKNELQIKIFEQIDVYIY